jgi:hypothetical protein
MSSQYGAGQDVVEELKKLIYADDSADVEAAAQPLQQKKVEKFAGIAQRLMREKYVHSIVCTYTLAHILCLHIHTSIYTPPMHTVVLLNSAARAAGRCAAL